MGEVMDHLRSLSDIFTFLDYVRWVSFGVVSKERPVPGCTSFSFRDPYFGFNVPNGVIDYIENYKELQYNYTSPSRWLECSLVRNHLVLLNLNTQVSYKTHFDNLRKTYVNVQTKIVCINDCKDTFKDQFIPSDLLVLVI